jgi:transposase
MAGTSPVTATQEQTTALKVLARGPYRAEADRARALLLTLKGWTSARIAQAFGVREDTVRLWRSDFSRGGVDALRARIAPGPSPVKAEAALRVAVPLLSAPVEDRRNWTRNRTLSRLEGGIARREGLSISRSQLSKVLRKKGGSASGGHGTC